MASYFKLKRIESIVYIIIWSIVILMSIYFSNTPTGINWSRVKHECIHLLPFFLVFIIHNNVLYPYFFIHKKQFWYFISAVTLVIMASYFTNIVGDYLNIKPAKNAALQPNNPLLSATGKHNIQSMLILKRRFDNIFVSLLVIGFNMAIKTSVMRQTEEQKTKDLEQEKMRTELAFLKNQVSPHFLMNTLNNINVLIDINAEDAKESVIKLSKLMRYLLYDSETGTTTLFKEIEFIKSYVDLMKLKFTEQVKINLIVPHQIPNITLPPMLFTSTLENAFKHGISYQKESFVEIKLNTDNDWIYFIIKNSKNEGNNGLNQPGGIGLENLKKRLFLLFKNNFEFQQKEDAETFEINIKLPIND